MPSYYQPEVKKYSEVHNGELITFFYDKGRGSKYTYFGIKIVMDKANGILVLSAVGDKNIEHLPLFIPLHYDGACISYGNEFIVESISDASEVFSDMTLQKGCIVSTLDDKFIACYHATYQGAYCVSLPDHKFMASPEYGVDFIHFPKWRVISLITEHGAPETHVFTVIDNLKENHKSD